MDIKVNIKTDTVAGRKLVREITKNPQAVESAVSAPTNEKTYTIEEVYHHGMQKLSELYGVDMYEIAQHNTDK